MADNLFVDQIRKMSDEDILKQIEDNRYEMYMLRLQKASGELQNTNLFRQNKRNLARLKTVLNERQRGVSQQDEGKK